MPDYRLRMVDRGYVVPGRDKVFEFPSDALANSEVFSDELDPLKQAAAGGPVVWVEVSLMRG